MKKSLLLIALVTSVFTFSQKKEKIAVPEWVNYKYCKPAVYEEAKQLTQDELVLNDPTYRLVTDNFIIGPVLWERLGLIEEIEEIEGGKVTFHVDSKKFEGKYIQSLSDGKIIWNQIRSEFNGVPMRLRKATYQELEYYWAVISFDIVEPLIVAETSERKYIFDLDPKTFNLDWIDEIPENIKEWLKGLD